MTEYTNEELMNMYNDLRTVVTHQDNTIKHLREVIQCYIKDEQRIQEKLQQFFEFLDYTEESDSGRVFHPITISSCRVLMTGPLNKVLEELKDFAYDDGEIRPLATAHETKRWADGEEL